jgi:tRNA-2-methylthio-N6-dimethylallyladenosine synthase
MKKKLYIKSFGCQMNKLDSSLVTNALKADGFTLVDEPEAADVVLINTCSVRENAEQRVFSHLGHLKYIKKTHPKLIVGVIGCMAQRLGDELLEHEAVDIVCGPAQISNIAELIETAINEHKPAVSITEKIRGKADKKTSESLDDFELTYDSDENHIKSQAFIRVMRGCNNFCTYCVVPYVRGPEVSRPPEAILEQVKKLTDKGIQQITLIGQTVNSYEYTAGDKTYRLADLLEMAANIDAVKWLRIITSHPKNFDEQILHAMADIQKVCPYLHVPAQSGSDRILKAMNRNYTAAEYLDLLDRARRIVPGIAIASDFIVGFPGETEEDFQQTVELVKKARFKNCFVFKYSPRPGTHTAKKLTDDISDEVKKRRNNELLAVQNAISEEESNKFLDKTIEVLVEGLSKKPHLNKAENNQMPQLVGRTATDHIVVFNGPESLAGQFTQVKVIKTAPLTLFGQIS